MKNFAAKYFERVNTFDSVINTVPKNDLKIIVVIPVFNEPEVDKTLISLMGNIFSEFTAKILFVINSAENTDSKIKKQNILSIELLKRTFKFNSNKNLSIEIIHFPDLPQKMSGVGVARKIGMDEALRIFSALNNPDGIIVSLDADTVTETNYLQEIFNFYSKNLKIHAANINFAHPTSGNEFSKEIYDAIKIYEIDLRYYVEALKFIGFPYSFHTIGSTISCKAKIYAQQGGMVTNQSGEDFYFLQKIIPVSNFSEITKTTVYPSPREANRVIFGTGIAVGEIINEYNFDYPAYKFSSFRILKQFFDKIEFLYNTEISLEKIKVDNILKEYLLKNNFYAKIKEIKNNTKEFDAFRKRFFNWFNAFRIVKFLNFYHEKYTKKGSTMFEANNLLKQINMPTSENPDELLEILRKLQ